MLTRPSPPTGSRTLGDPRPAPEAALRRLQRHFAHYLGQLEHRQTTRDPKANGFAFAAVPDWALRQQLDLITSMIGEVADV